MKGRRSRFIASLLLALFCWHSCSATLFPHTHVIDGRVICHSHPFSGTADNPGHAHTKVQFETINHLSLLLMVAATLAGLLLFLPGVSLNLNRSQLDRVIHASFHTYRLRGPPVC